MKIEITEVINGITSETEFVRFKVLEDINLHGFAVVDKTFNGEGYLSNIFKHFYRFPSVDLKKRMD